VSGSGSATIVHRTAEKFNMAEFIEIKGGLRIPDNEVSFVFARSGGPGGQNVNKVSTRVELLFDIGASRSLDAAQKSILRSVLRNRTGAGGILRVRSDASRSQWKNRQDALRKFSHLLARALQPAKKRASSRPTRASRAERLAAKKRKGALKQSRGRVGGDE
jgi:ribosome-associated protein